MTYKKPRALQLTRQRYSEQFKDEALKLLGSVGVSAAAERSGCTKSKAKACKESAWIYWGDEMGMGNDFQHE